MPSPYSRRPSSQEPRDRRSRPRTQQNHVDALKVASTSDIGSVGGAIAHRIREGDLFAMDAAGSTCVNILVKSIFRARQYLVDDNLDILCTPDFHNPTSSALHSALRIYLEGRPMMKPREANGLLILAKAQSDPRSVAGAIATNVRSAKFCAITSRGAEAVNKAIKAIVFARRYLNEENIDISFQPSFPFTDSNELHLVIHVVDRL
eukprot:TRINITY_DN69046_c0_g1_i1.p1 TRINITY_DN69046_c0_g1~~TRINITY_DN69046_c0_g1_i1.p1  ORF type:complete len:213 (-),score=29.86 TRINITY_DN69046_c0_g1_i1:19-636(-)